ncbi:hypothetical protein D3C77_555500 [compost metagenome]
MHGAGRQPVDQLLLALIQAQGGGTVEQAAAGIGMLAQLLVQPVLPGHIEHQAIAAGVAGAGVMSARRYHDQPLSIEPGTMPLHLELQAAAQAEHQLRVFVAVGDQAVAVMAQREDRAGGHGESRPRRAEPHCASFPAVHHS